MKTVFVITISGKVQPKVFNSFKSACEDCGISHNGARGKRLTGITRGEITITPAQLVKMTARNTFARH